MTVAMQKGITRGKILERKEDPTSTDRSGSSTDK